MQKNNRHVSLEFGSRLRAHREKQGLSIAEMAKLSKISPSYLSRLESSNRLAPGFEITEKISKALQVDVRELLGPRKVLQRNLDGAILGKNSKPSRVYNKKSKITDKSDREFEDSIRATSKNIERNLSLFMGFYSPKIREVISMEGYLEFEKKLDKRRVDIYVEGDNNDTFIEVQIKDSDKSHLKQIKSIISDNTIIDGSRIAWLATGFKTEHLSEVETAVSNSKNKLDFYAFEISGDMINKLEDYAEVDEFSIIDKLGDLTKYDDTKLITHISNYDPHGCQVKQRIRKISKDEELVRYYIKEIRDQIPNWSNAYNSKVLCGRKIFFGAGAGDLTFKFGFDRYEMLAVELGFAHAQFELFDALYDFHDTISKRMNPKPEFSYKNHKIHYTVPYNEENKEEILKSQVSVLKYFLFFFDPLIRNRDRIISTKINSERREVIETLLDSNK